jgi:REP element-mobilizing transposase RayT
MSPRIDKPRNVSIIMYHIVCPAKYRRAAVITEEVDKKLKEICLEIEKRYEIKFLEIGTEKDHVHFLIQSVPAYSPANIVQRIKSITAGKIFEACSEVKNPCGEVNSGHGDII